MHALTHLTLCVSVSTDYVLTQDKSFKKWVKAYAESQDLWFKEYVPARPRPFSSISRCDADGLNYRSFSAVVATLFELGVPSAQFVSSEPWVIPTVDEQGSK